MRENKQGGLDTIMPITMWQQTQKQTSIARELLLPKSGEAKKSGV